jgi:adenosylhomocysteine nucleosidase
MSIRSEESEGSEGSRLTAIVSPLPAELAAVRAATSVTAAERAEAAEINEAGGGLGLVCGRLGGAPVVLASTGDGAPAAARGLAALLDAVPVSRLLVLGVAGGLSPELAPGDLVAARRVVEDGGEVALPDPGWLAAALAGGAVAGSAVTTRRILVTAEEKRAAWLALGDSGPAVVDLESAAYARLAAARGIPCLVVRAVIDAADETLPLDFNRARRAEGGVEEARVVRMALCKPQVWGALADLRRRLRRGARALARIAIHLAAAGSTSQAAPDLDGLAEQLAGERAATGSR